MNKKSSLLYSAVLTCVAAFSVCAAAAQAQPTDISATVNLDADAAFDVREETYTLPDAKLPSTPDLGPDFPLTPEMVGLVVSPVNATGPRPVALFIHGQSNTCYDPTTNVLQSGWPCPEGNQSVPSYRGFLEHQRFLAARGWVTLSISGNGISGHIVATGEQIDTILRSELAEAHLQQWALWLAGDTTQPPPVFISSVQPDLQQLLLVGHSRGGSAANQLAARNVGNAALPWKARALVLIGPVALQINPVATLPTVVLLPGCDGDVFNLQGQSYIDRGRDLNPNNALRSAVFIHGANHKFFNSEWDATTATVRAAGSDDALALFENRTPEGACRPGAPERLSGDAQRELGSFYIAAAGKAFVQGNVSVSQLFDGSPVCAGPTCRSNIQTQALGGRRQQLLIPNAESTFTATEQVSISSCQTTAQVDEEGACITADMPTIQSVTRTPHFIPALIADGVTQDPSLTALRVDWTAPRGSAWIDASHRALSSDATHIVARVIVSPGAVNSQFALNLVDAAGSVLSLGLATLSGVPANAGAATGVYWAQELRFPINVAAATAAGFDVNAVQSVEITPQSTSGTLWLLDIWNYAPGLAP